MKKTLKMKYEPTARGFDCYEFTDFYGDKCSLQKSSLAEIDAIWFGCNESRTHTVTGQALSPRMHLTREQVAELLPKLRHFVRTGNLPRPRKPLIDAQRTKAT
jgi:hypothetical protein